MKNTQGPLVLHPPAKVNVVLKVLGRLPNGYHTLWSIMQTVGLTDELEMRLSSSFSGVRLECPGSLLAPDSNNLVFRAAEAFLELSRSDIGVELVLRKHIPMGAGLGGGSSDAAATIMGLNHLLQLGVSAEDMARLGQRLGSDVPFFFYAPSVLVRGCGEDLRPLTIQGTRWVVLVNPGFPISTQGAYRLLDRVRGQTQESPVMCQEAEPGEDLIWDNLVPLMSNDFERVLFEEYPLLADIHRRLLEVGAERALVSGSGATVFGVFPSEEEALKAERLLEPSPEWQVWVVPTPAPGPLFKTS